MTTSEIIRSVVLHTVAEQGLSASEASPYVGPVVEALTERVYEVVDLIVDKAGEVGMSEHEATEYLASIGLDSRPQPEPVEEEEAEPLTVEDQVAALTEAVSSLAGTVGKLVTLAETKLGVTL